MLLLADDMIEIIPVFAIGVGGTIALVAIASGAVTRLAISRGRERTRREIAAYVAEGTIDPADAVALLEAGASRGEIRDARARERLGG